MLSHFPYVTIPQPTGHIFKDIKALLYANNKPKTFEHVQAVGEASRKIADQYGLDKEICAISGYLHDISAVIAPRDMVGYAVEKGLYIDEAERRHPFLFHQRMSRLIAEQDFGIIDERILSSIECHSTLKASPTEYDMVLFIADKLAWDQEGVPPFYDILQGALENSLEAASLAYMEYIVTAKMILYPHRWFMEGMAFLKSCSRP